MPETVERTQLHHPIAGLGHPLTVIKALAGRYDRHSKDVPDEKSLDMRRINLPEHSSISVANSSTSH